MANQYFNIIQTIINIIVIAVFIFAFLSAETKGRVIMTVLLALLFALPAIFTASVIYWLCYAGKIIFALYCYLSLKSRGYSI
jgi:hypothetical protein